MQNCYRQWLRLVEAAAQLLLVLMPPPPLLLLILLLPMPAIVANKTVAETTSYHCKLSKLGTVSNVFNISENKNKNLNNASYRF